MWCLPHILFPPTRSCSVQLSNAASVTLRIRTLKNGPDPGYDPVSGIKSQKRKKNKIKKKNYHRFRGEMYDRDIQLLQFCGANLEPNQFLLHALHKFGLSNWASKVKYYFDRKRLFVGNFVFSPTPTKKCLKNLCFQ